MYVRDDDGVTTPGCDDGGGWARIRVDDLGVLTSHALMWVFQI